MIFLVLMFLPYFPTPPMINVTVPHKIEQPSINPVVEHINNLYKAELAIRRSA